MSLLTVLASQSAAEPASITILYDSFTDTPGTAITAHTPDTVNAPASGSWNLISSGAVAFTINDAGTGLKKTVGSGTNRPGVWFECGVSDCIIATTSLLASYDCIAFRNATANANNYWAARRVASAISLREVVNGSETSRGSYTAADGSVPIAAIANGENIDVYVDGTLRISYALAASLKTETKHGLRAVASTNPLEVAPDIYVINSTDPADIPV